MKNWVLWLDDIRNPVVSDQRELWEGFELDPPFWCTSVEQASAMIELHGLPSFMFLDHDLDHGEDTMSFLRRLEYYGYIENNDPPNYYIISANPVGSMNIQAFMESWKKTREL
jgi:hypothetical protein